MIASSKPFASNYRRQIRLKGTQPEVPPPNVKDLGFDSAYVKTGLLTGLRAAGIAVTYPHLSTGPEHDEDDQWWWHIG